MTRRYVPGPGIDEQLAWYEGSGVGDRRFLYQDERGSVVAIANDAGSVLARFRYGPWGETADTGFTRFGYAGALKLPGTDLLHMRARVYAAGLGRFLSADPIGFASGQLNLYAYVGNDPVNFVDPLGLMKDCKDGGGGNGGSAEEEGCKDSGDPIEEILVIGHPFGLSGGGLSSGGGVSAGGGNALQDALMKIEEQIQKFIAEIEKLKACIAAETILRSAGGATTFDNPFSVIIKRDESAVFAVDISLSAGPGLNLGRFPRFGNNAAQIVIGAGPAFSPFFNETVSVGAQVRAIRVPIHQSPAVVIVRGLGRTSPVFVKVALIARICEADDADG